MKEQGRDMGGEREAGSEIQSGRGGRGVGMRVQGGGYKSIPLKVSLLLVAFIPTQCRKGREAREREEDKEENWS